MVSGFKSLGYAILTSSLLYYAGVVCCEYFRGEEKRGEEIKGS